MDQKETFNICLGPADPNLVHPLTPTPKWPRTPLNFKQICTTYYRNLEALASDILQLIAVSLELPINWFQPFYERHRSILRLINYPAVTQSKVRQKIRAGAHTDYGTIAILKDDGNSGLQIFIYPNSYKAKWVSVKIPQDCYCVNIGDMMALWTNDIFKSTLHRVTCQTSKRRQSIVFFHNLSPDALIQTIPSCKIQSKIRKPVRAGEYWEKKFYSAY